MRVGGEQFQEDRADLLHRLYATAHFPAQPFGALMIFPPLSTVWLCQ